MLHVTFVTYIATAPLTQNTLRRLSYCFVGLEKACNFIQKRIQHSCFPVKIVKFLRTSSLKNMCEQLFLPMSVNMSFHQRNLIYCTTQVFWYPFGFGHNWWLRQQCIHSRIRTLIIKLQHNFPFGIYLFKVNNRTTRKRC